MHQLLAFDLVLRVVGGPPFRATHSPVPRQMLFLPLASFPERELGSRSRGRSRRAFAVIARLCHHIHEPTCHEILIHRVLIDEDQVLGIFRPDKREVVSMGTRKIAVSSLPLRKGVGGVRWM